MIARRSKDINSVTRQLLDRSRAQFSTEVVPVKMNLPATVKAYAELSKFRLSSLVVVTTGAGFACVGVPFDPVLFSSACSGTALCAASASTFNQVIERDRDLQMKRTLTRPLPSGKVSVAAATSWGVFTGAIGTSMLLLGTNPVVAALGLGNIVLYAGPYTMLKPRSEINTWVGSLVGAIPPVMGYAAATGGNLMALEPLALASLLFLWQFPHFFALSWLHRKDYARGGFEMVAVNDPTGKRTSELILEYSAYLTLLPIACSMAGMTSYMFSLEGTAANLYLLYLGRKFHNDRTSANARRIFLCSLWYLPVLLAGFVFHSTSNSNITATDVDSPIAATIARSKEVLRGYCVHEAIVHNDDLKSPHLCAKVATDQAAAEVANNGAEVVETMQQLAADSTSNQSKVAAKNSTSNNTGSSSVHS